MRPMAVAAFLAALGMPPALAQVLEQAPPPPAAGAPSDSKLPLAAMRHQQPRRADVEQLEQERLGPKAGQIEKQQRAAEDKLFEDVMRRSAPGAAGQ